MWPTGILLLTLLCSSPQSRTASEWTAAGWQALRAGHASRGGRGFSQRAAPRWTRRARDAGGRGQRAPARQADRRTRAAGECARDSSGLTAASSSLGELLYRDADLAGAIQVYEQALTLAPSQPQIIARLNAWRREAALHDRFSHKIETHFTILFEGPPDQTRAARVAEILEAAYWRIGGAIGAYPASVVQVVLYTTGSVSRHHAVAGVGWRRARRENPRAGWRDDCRIRAAARPVARAHARDRLQPCAARRAAMAERRACGAVREGRFCRASDGWSRARPSSRLPQLQTSFDALSGTQAALAYAESAIAARRRSSIRADRPPCSNLLERSGEAGCRSTRRSSVRR